MTIVQSTNGVPPIGVTNFGDGGSLSSNVQTEALNGAQIASLLSIVQQCAQRGIPPETASSMIIAAFPLLTTEQVNSIISPLQNFTPTTAAPAPSPPPANGNDEGEEQAA